MVNTVQPVAWEAAQSVGWFAAGLLLLWLLAKAEH